MPVCGILDAIWKKMSDSGYRAKIVQTLCTFYCFIGLGICSAQTGPTLLDLQLITHTNTHQASFFLTAKGLGSMIGALTMGAVFNRWEKMLLMALASVGVAFSVAVLPLTSSYILMIFMHLVMGFFEGSLLTGGNTNTMRIWDDERRIVVQLLYFCFALGGTLAPLIVQPFLAASVLSNSSDVPLNGTFSLLTECLPVNNCLINASDKSRHDFDQPQTHVQYAYLLNGSIVLLSALLFFLRYCCFPRTEDLIKHCSGSYKDLSKRPLKLQIPIFALLATVFVLIVATDSSMASFLLTFVVNGLDWTKVSGTRITSLFWLCIAMGRFLVILTTNYISPFCTNVITYTLSLSSIIGILLSSVYRNIAGVWICVAVSGLSMSSMFPTTLTWVEESIFRVTPRLMSFVLFVTALSAMVNPPLIGYLMQNISHLWFLYLLIIECCIALILIVIIYMWTNCIFNSVYEELESNNGPILD